MSRLPGDISKRAPGTEIATLRAGAAAAVAFAGCLFSGPRVINWLKARKVREDVTKKDSKRLTEIHSGKKDTPTMGGLFLIGSALVAALAFADLRTPAVLGTLGAIAVLWGVGYADDWIKLRTKKAGMAAKPRLAIQGAVGFALGWLLWKSGHSTQIAIPFVKATIDLGMGYPILAALVMAATTNAVNLTDGLDGLAGGCFLAAGLAYTGILYVAGRADLSAQLGIPHVPGASELAILGAALVGATLGFMWFNCFPAQVFMGNTGSLPLGGALAAMALVAKQELLLVVIGAVFVGEALSVILQVLSFKSTGRRIFKIAPIHHHFQFDGIPESKITARFWIASAISALAGLAALRAG
ncbi:MAG: phospho-N-acetylmuramoyl-pentapeptide-transferase [Planctomycetes bacterium]|nr:phospho-N-acetylmuramoyl-pentapeptide-transferase [Planctomycetota bacterium]